MRGGRGPIITGVAVLVLGLIGLGAAVWLVVDAAVDGGSKLAYAPRLVVGSSGAVTRAVTLDEAAYTVYGSSEDAVTTTVTDVSVSVPNGDGPVVRLVSGSRHLTTRSQDYVAVASFHAPAKGQYLVTVKGDEGDEALVGPDVVQIGLSMVKGAGVGVLGLVLVAVGIVVLVVAGSRRRRARPAAGPAYQGQPYPGQPYPGQQPSHQGQPQPWGRPPPYPDPHPSAPPGPASPDQPFTWPDGPPR